MVRSSHYPDSLRDNCRCPECRIAQTEEKQFQLAALDDADGEATVVAGDKELALPGPAGHQSHFEDSSSITAIKYPR